MLEHDFMVRALVAALVTGLMAPAIGTYLVQRRMSLIGDGIGHVALTGVGIGLLLHRSPVVAAVVVSAVAAVAIELLRERGKTSGDVALAILFYGGISGGVVLVSLAPAAGSRSLVSYLFGSPLTTSAADLVVVGALGAVVIAVAVLARPWLFAVCQDEEYARVAGLPVRALNVTLAVVTAVTVTASMRTVGLLLVSALMVVPVATAQQLTRGFAATMHGAMALGVAAAAGGLVASYRYDTAPGATVVLLAIALFVAVSLGGAAWRAARFRHGAAAEPALEPELEPEPPEVVLDR